MLYVYTVSFRGYHATQNDIHAAFVAAIQLNPKGYRCLRTEDFIRELSKVHWHFSRTDANEWIQRYQPDFTDKTTDGTDNHYWILRLVNNQVLLILSGGRTQFARVMEKALITEDGEAIEGAAAEEVEVMGRVTFFINSAMEDDGVV